MSRSKCIPGTRGFTLTEIVVVLGIVGFLASILMPVLARVRREAGQATCTNNLRQIGQALTMYNVDHSSSFERYPDRLTHLRDLGYVGDARVFICPLDYTHATRDGASGRTGLKPYYSPQIPSNDYYYWAERDPPIDSSDWLISADGTAKTSNCSYIYEFSTRSQYVGGYVPTGDPKTVTWSSGGWAADTLVSQYSYNLWDGFPPDYTDNSNVQTVEWYSGWDADGFPIIASGIAYPANPMDVDRDKNPRRPGIITWQDAKFFQLQNADAYVTGYLAPGDPGIPVSWSWDPSDTCNANDYMRMPNYPRALMPIVRCFWHSRPAEVDNQDVESVLNLAVDGNTFYSVPGWEQSAWKYGHGSTQVVP